MDRDEFRRRIKVYLDVDLPTVGQHEEIAAALSDRLFQYVRQPLDLPDGDSETLGSLLDGERVLLFFWAKWDGSAPGYRAVVDDVAHELSLRVVDIEIDDPVGAGVARLLSVANTPCVVDSGLPATRVIGGRTRDDLLKRLRG